MVFPADRKSPRRICAITPCYHSGWVGGGSANKKTKTLGTQVGGRPTRERRMKNLHWRCYFHWLDPVKGGSMVGLSPTFNVSSSLLRAFFMTPTPSHFVWPPLPFPHDAKTLIAWNVCFNDTRWYEEQKPGRRSRRWEIILGRALITDVEIAWQQAISSWMDSIRRRSILHKTFDLESLPKTDRQKENCLVTCDVLSTQRKQQMIRSVWDSTPDCLKRPIPISNHMKFPHHRVNEAFRFWNSYLDSLKCKYFNKIALIILSLKSIWNFPSKEIWPYGDGDGFFDVKNSEK